MKIGITGSIACGKSTICRYLQDNGYTVIDTDKLSYLFTTKGNLCYNDIVDYFGEEILLDNKEIDRKKLGSIVFNNKEKKEKLESIIHPHIKKAIEEYESNGIVFFEVPLLYEAHMEDLFHKVITIYVDEKEQIERLIDRNKLTYQEAMNRINNQMGLKEKVSKADYVIDNSNSVEDSYKQIENILKGLKQYEI